MARKILLADDSVTAQNMGRKILTDAGYEVITVNNGSAALKRVGEQKPDLIVLDVYMPGYSGLEVCQRLKDAPDTSRIPILLTVGKLEPFKPEEARRVQADAFIVKPFEASELLSALTRLEDRMVPQSEASRFGSGVSGIERFNNESGFGRGTESAGDETDSGWKNRIRFPSEKKKAEESEPEPEDFSTTTPSRDYRRGAGKAPAASAPFSVNSTPGQAPGLVPDIPRDITPDELDALSALAAKLDGPVQDAPAQSEEAAPASGKSGPAEIPAATAAAKAEVEAPAASAPSAAPGTIPTFPVAEAVPPPATAEAIPAPPAFETVRVLPDLTPPAPVDRDDEPRFATAPSPEIASEVATAENRHEEKPFAQPQEAIPEAVAAAHPAEHAVSQPHAEASTPETAAPAQSASRVGEVAQNAAPAAHAEEAVPERVPTEEELAEALRLLTPSQPEADTVAVARQEEAVTVPADVVQALEEVGRGNGFVGRWMAEPVALSAEEAAVSLEAEMFQKFSMSSAAETPAAVETAPAALAEPPAEVAEARAEPSMEQAAAPEIAAVEVAAAPEKKIEDVPPAEEPEPATTFASGMQHDESHEAEMPAAPVEMAVAPEAVYQSSSADEVGGQDDMARDKSDKTKTAWSNWHQIRAGSTPAGAPSDPVQAAKDAEAQQAAETPKAMAAAAAGDGGSTTDESNDIANIVDSVLADLRPKIVEEISKKLGKSKKR